MATILCIRRPGSHTLTRIMSAPPAPRFHDDIAIQALASPSCPTPAHGDLARIAKTLRNYYLRGTIYAATLTKSGRISTRSLRALA